MSLNEQLSVLRSAAYYFDGVKETDSTPESARESHNLDGFSQIYAMPFQNLHKTFT